MSRERKTSRLLFPLVVLAALAATFAASLFVHTPDRPVETIAPGSSSEPNFVVQVIRPRSGLPLGGVLPPGWFGVDDRLVFDASSAGAEVRAVEAGRVALAAEDWSLELAFDDQGRALSGTTIEFELVFEERRQRVRCSAGEAAGGTVETAPLDGGDALWGRFDVELPRCVYADSGEPLGWPSKPLVLHGSFDRLPLAR